MSIKTVFVCAFSYKMAGKTRNLHFDISWCEMWINDKDYVVWVASDLNAEMWT